MEKYEGNWVISPRDLIAELECDHRLHLDWAVAEKIIDSPKKEWSDQLQLLIDLGEVHENQISNSLEQLGTFRKVEKPAFTTQSLNEATETTKRYIEEGIETIAQATLFTGDFLGFADFLILCRDEHGKPVRDDAGRFVYDPIDAKSSRSAKRAAVLQVASYAYAMMELGLATPQNIHLWLGGENRWSTAATNLNDLVDDYLSRIRNKIALFTSSPNPLWAAPRESCGRCRWQNQCVIGREDALDLSLVQNIRSSSRLALIESGILTIDALASASDDQRPITPKEVSKETFTTLRAQADIQVRGRGSSSPIWEMRDIEALGLLPKSDEGDIWFDMEGDPFAHSGEGLEYMFGFTFLSGNTLDFKTFDARDRNEEGEAFKSFISYVLERRNTYPDMHIYHYASYEVSAMLRLALRHGTFEVEVDSLIRDGVFVDLYAIVRRSFRFSTESMSIKYIEAVYQEKRGKEKAVATAVDSVIKFEEALSYLRNGDEAKFISIYKGIRDYNKDDCDSTFHLDRWIREQAIEQGIDIDRLRPAAREKFFVDSEEEVEPIALQLISTVPSDPMARNKTQNALALLSGAISFHRREERPAWRALFERADSALDELDKFNDVLVVTEASTGPWGLTGRQRKKRRQVILESEGIEISQILEPDSSPQALYEVVPDGFKQMQGSTRGFNDCSIISIDASTIVIEETEKLDTWDATPIALLPPVPYMTQTIRAVLRDELGGTVLQSLATNPNPFPKGPWSDLLLKNPPRQLSEPLPHTGDIASDIVKSLIDSDISYIPVQGPPGTGKTFIGGQVIATLAKQGWKIGVVAQSHAVIENLLDGVVEHDSTIKIAKKGQANKSTKPYHVSDVADWAGSQNGGFVIGGTVWSFCASSLRAQRFDLIVIDEAGQFSLANALAVLSAGDRGLFLGDPQQLPQVSQASHPEPVEVSVLGHILGSHATMPPNLGYFLDTTYRLHPKLAEPVSKLQYEGKLHSAEQCSLRNLEGVVPGLHIVEVDHSGNTIFSIEEAEAVADKAAKLIGLDWIDVSNGKATNPRALTQRDILVVAAYNKQVRQIKTCLAEKNLGDIRVGTFDKFQGQEAPVVLVSMATSSSEDLPRGIDFLLSPNRLNVAISRAKWACFLYRSPQLSVMEPNSPDGMVMLGKFISMCRRI